MRVLYIYIYIQSGLLKPIVSLDYISDLLLTQYNSRKCCILIQGIHPVWRLLGTMTVIGWPQTVWTGLN